MSLGLGFVVSYVTLWLLVAFQFFVCVGLLREVTSLRGIPELDRLPVGGRAPAFAGTDLHTGGRISSKSYAGQAFGILVVSPSCPVCVRLLESLDGIGELEFPLLIACSKDEGQCRKVLRSPRTNMRFLVDTDADLRQPFGVSGSPSAIVVDVDGRVSGYSRLANADELIQFFAETITAPAPEDGIAARAGAAGVAP
jgi:hypothetical protein